MSAKVFICHGVSSKLHVESLSLTIFERFIWVIVWCRLQVKSKQVSHACTVAHIAFLQLVCKGLYSHGVV